MLVLLLSLFAALVCFFFCHPLVGLGFAIGAALVFESIVVRWMQRRGNRKNERKMLLLQRRRDR